MSSEQLANIMFGSVFLFIGLVACAFAAIRRGGEVRLFAWLGIWSAMRGVRLLAKSPSVVAVLPHWLQVCAPFLWVATMYLTLPVAVLAWLELTVGKVRPFLKAVIVGGFLIGLAGIGVFAVTRSKDRLMIYSDLLAIAALLLLVVVVSLPRLARRFLVLPNRAVVVVGTLVFALEGLHFSLADTFHYKTTEITGSLAFAVLLFSFGYVAAQMVLANEHRLLKIHNELAIARTSYRLTEHYHYWTKNNPMNVQLVPEPFVEISAEMAQEMGITGGEKVKVSSIRGTYIAKAMVTKRSPSRLPGNRRGRRQGRQHASESAHPDGL